MKQTHVYHSQLSKILEKEYVERQVQIQSHNFKTGLLVTTYYPELTGMEVKGTEHGSEGRTAGFSLPPRIGELGVNSRTEMTLVNRCACVGST